MTPETKTVILHAIETYLGPQRSGTARGLELKLRRAERYLKEGVEHELFELPTLLHEICDELERRHTGSNGRRLIDAVRRHFPRPEPQFEDTLRFESKFDGAHATFHFDEDSCTVNLEAWRGGPDELDADGVDKLIAWLQHHRRKM